MDKKKWDFIGWATRHNVLCNDGRTIKQSAFKDDNNKSVPLVWNHNHNDADNVLGHALLKHMDEGVRVYGKFNDTPQGENARQLVRHKDVTALSVYANRVMENNKDVVHGIIREVSLVLAGANPGAYIETVMYHNDNSNESDLLVFTNSEIAIQHNDSDVNDGDNISTEDDQNIKHSTMNEDSTEDEKMDKNIDEKDETIQEVFDTLNEKQKKMVHALVGAALESVEENEENEGDNNMKHNAFENDNNLGNNGNGKSFAHGEFEKIVSDAKRTGSLKESFIQHGIEEVDVLFPEVRNMNTTPELISRDMDWVEKVMQGVSRTPFSRVKSTAANITEDEARARGYIKGKQKVEEVIKVLKRSTTPTTVYKLQKMDRDDVIDITDFDVVVFLKQEMRMMLNEELARAFLIGDGRIDSSDDKIDPLNIRPIYGDHAVYTVKKVITPASNATAAAKAKELIQTIVRSRKEYKGSGNPTLFTTEDQLVEMLLLEDLNGRVIYDTIDKLNTALRVKEIVTVPVMEGVNRIEGDDQYDLLGILVNLTDYNVGADKGGAINMFEDFDLNLNKHEYLIETRCSGALKKPYSAITFESKGTVVAG